MKKWLIGCLVTGLLLVVVVCGAAYWFVWRPLAASGGDLMGQVDDLKKIGEAEQAVKNKSPFTAPVDGKLSAAQVNAFVTAQQTIHDKMGPDFAVLEEKYKKMSEQETAPDDASLKDVMGAYADITGLMAKAKQAQVEALNVQNMSLEEYRWIRDQVSAALPYLAVDAPAPATNTDTATEAVVTDDNAVADKAVNDAIAEAQKAAAEAVKESIPGGQQIGDVMQGPESEAARANIELLRPHKELLYKTMTSAWLSM
ncbi:MAG: hypothetical protein ACREPB_03820 [Arenimonas sp.]